MGFFVIKNAHYPNLLDSLPNHLINFLQPIDIVWAVKKYPQSLVYKIPRKVMIIGTLYIIAAPSGAGKTSLVNALVDQLEDILVSVSHTTRAPRPGEQSGVHYHFIDQASFEAMLQKSEFLEHAQVFDHYYGTSEAWVTTQLKAGKDVILEIDWQGAQQVRHRMPQCISIFILPPSKASLEQRLRTRSQDEESVIHQRMAKAVEEIAHYVEFDYLIVNEDFDKALNQLQAIVDSHRLKQSIQAQKLQSLLQALLNEK